MTRGLAVLSSRNRRAFNSRSTAPGNHPHREQLVADQQPAANRYWPRVRLPESGTTDSPTNVRRVRVEKSRGLSLTAPWMLALCVFGISLLSPGVVWAHAALQTSSPEAGERVGVAPSSIRIDFTEPLSTELSGAELFDSASNAKVAQRPIVDTRSIRLTPLAVLRRGSYRVEWRAVSTLDGHPVEGSFGFGVRAPPPKVGQSVSEDPLEQNGIARIAARAVFYSSVLIFVGGLLVAALWNPRRRDSEGIPAPVPDGLTGRAALVAGAIAVIAAAVVLSLDTSNAGGDLRFSTFVAYGIDNVSGRSRLIATMLLALALFATWRKRLGAAVVCATAATGAIALSGHANSADPRAVSLITDWMHLIAASVWIGGMTHMALMVRKERRAGGHWLPPLLPAIDRFGDLAVPAFLATIVTGLYNMAIELGGIVALWKTDYGVVLTVKIVLVVGLLLVSVVHSRMLRPRASEPIARDRRQTTYWRVIANEPVLAFGIVVLAATLAVFPLPPRQNPQPSAGVRQSTCESCLDPAPGEASFASQAGSTLVAAWVRREPNGIVGRIRTFNRAGEPVDRDTTLNSGNLTESCGIGCRRFDAVPSEDEIAGRLTENGAVKQFVLSGRWKSQSSRDARALIREIQARMQALRSLRADEKIAVNATIGTQTAFESRSPDRLSFGAANGAAGVIIGRRRWSRAPASAEWIGPTVDFERYRTKDSFDWVANARFVWLLDSPKDSQTIRVALMNPAEPVWYELQVDRKSKLVIREKMTSPGHFMKTRYFDFNSPITIVPPR